MIASVDPGGGSMIDVERINSQLSLSREKVIVSVDPGGDGSTIDMERINSQLSLLIDKVITFVDLGGGIDAPWDIPCVARVGH